MKDENKKEKVDIKKIKPLLVYFKDYKWHFIIGAIIIFITNLSYILTGYLNGAAIESVVNGAIATSIKFFVIYFFVEIITEVVGRIIYYILGKDQVIISRKMGFDTYKKALNLPAVAFEEMSSGEIINRVTNDTEVIIGSVGSLISLISRLVSSFIILIYIFFKSWIIGLEITVFLIIYYFMMKYYTEKLKKYHKERKKRNDKFTAIANESIRGIREIKTLGIIANLCDNVTSIIMSMLDASIKEQKVERNYDVISSFLTILLECGTFITCAILVFYGQMTVTFFIAMTYYIYRFTYLLEYLNSFTKTYEQLVVALGRINELLANDLYDDVQYGDKNLKTVTGVLEFKDVLFNYKGEETIINKFNLKFEPNKKIALVGSSGEGKSTLFNLITRIFDPVEGNIYLDGVDLRELTEESLRRNISIIRQEPFIFNKTIKENFELVEPNVKLDKIRKYCKLASIDDYIMSLPDKYDTVIGEGGVNLSGGQKQRLSIARTLLKKSKVILFDEATSALDNESQESIKRSIDELAKDHTVLIVAHRLSTIIDADIIHVIKNGKVYASGTHEELMKTCKFYQKLYTTEADAK